MAEMAAANIVSGIQGLQSDNSANAAPAAPNSTFKWTDGGYVTIACIFGIATADTKIGPIVLGILTIGLIYQLTLLIQGK